MWNNPTQAIERVRDHVNRNQPNDHRLVVNDDPSAIRHEEGWWYLVVRPDRNGVRAHEYSECLSDIEEELWNEEQVHVLLVPMLTG